ncbi:uncharacterized protein LOC119311126 [Triticum dicoccoides]|uniref:uncharacterized protein LOC119311126 n=1 Tax=Triticum dicoccoides TaxID=85692 RepID=UPI000E7AC1F0|nr:uncharacterized protein LOC119311126 [Triticum dicoccoides]XP_044389690.1 uncharacterized protein LOC123112690 [Triticum aestivum]
MTFEDMEAPNLCRPPIGDASNGAPLGDISNVDHHSRMTPVPMPASHDLTPYGSHCQRVNLASNTNIARKKKRSMRKMPIDAILAASPLSINSPNGVQELSQTATSDLNMPDTVHDDGEHNRNSSIEKGAF